MIANCFLVFSDPHNRAAGLALVTSDRSAAFTELQALQGPVKSKVHPMDRYIVTSSLPYVDFSKIRLACSQTVKHID